VYAGQVYIVTTHIVRSTANNGDYNTLIIVYQSLINIIYVLLRILSRALDNYSASLATWCHPAQLLARDDTSALDSYDISMGELTTSRRR
jgi:hypothetical protein